MNLLDGIDHNDIIVYDVHTADTNEFLGHAIVETDGPGLDQDMADDIINRHRELGISNWNVADIMDGIENNYGTKVVLTGNSDNIYMG